MLKNLLIKDLEIAFILISLKIILSLHKLNLSPLNLARDLRSQK